MKSRKIAAKKKFQQSPAATSRSKPIKAGTGIGTQRPKTASGISSLSAKVDNVILTATKKLVLLSNGQYRLGNRVFTPGQGYSIKHTEGNRESKVPGDTSNVEVYFVVWDYDKERTRISKGTAEQLINLAKSARSNYPAFQARNTAPKKAAAKKGAPKKAAAKKAAFGGSAHPQGRINPKRSGKKK